MREIEFRGKRVDNGEWVYGYFFILPSGAPAILNYYMGYVQVIPETVGQYAGLNDKNDIPIFDGDIARVKHEGKTYVGIIQNDAFAVFMFVARSLGWIPLHDLITDSDIEETLVGNTLCIGAVEVIGNITDDNVDDFTGGKK